MRPPSESYLRKGDPTICERPASDEYELLLAKYWLAVAKSATHDYVCANIGRYQDMRCAGLRAQLVTCTRGVRKKMACLRHTAREKRCRSVVASAWRASVSRGGSAAKPC